MSERARRGMQLLADAVEIASLNPERRSVPAMLGNLSAAVEEFRRADEPESHAGIVVCEEAIWLCKELCEEHHEKEEPL